MQEYLPLDRLAKLNATIHPSFGLVTISKFAAPLARRQLTAFDSA